MADDEPKAERKLCTQCYTGYLDDDGCPVCWVLAQPIDEITGRNELREMGGMLDRTYAIGLAVIVVGGCVLLLVAHWTH